MTRDNDLESEGTWRYSESFCANEKEAGTPWPEVEKDVVVVGCGRRRTNDGKDADTKGPRPPLEKFSEIM